MAQPQTYTRRAGGVFGYCNRMVRLLYLRYRRGSCVRRGWFFATNDPFMGVLASLATFAVGFVARPFGALVFGHLGDKVGRKKSLVITLVLMGSATTAIGLLPSFHSIGVTATILLVILRLAQGVAVGGEWGGAVLIDYRTRAGKVADLSRRGSAIWKPCRPDPLHPGVPSGFPRCRRKTSQPGAGAFPSSSAVCLSSLHSSSVRVSTKAPRWSPNLNGTAAMRWFRCERC